MMRRYARVARLPRRLILPVPVLTPRLSALWINLVTPVPRSIATPLIESLVHDVVRREPPRPVLLVVEPIERRERDDAGIEPAVTNLLHRLAVRPARWAADHDVVDPRPVQLAELVEAALRELPQLLFATDDEEVAVRARIERKRQAPVALSADVPVAHVL